MRYRACMARRFLPLAPEEPIGVVALSGPVESRERLAAGLEELRRWGHPVVLAPNLTERAGFLAGDDAVRVAGLRWVIQRGARVLVAVRGGYGVTRILSALAIDGLASAGVCFVGFSDATAVLNAMAAEGAGPQIHGPMVAAGLARRDNADRLRSMLAGELVGRALFRFGPARVLRPGRVAGIALGGNLSLLASLVATPYEPNLDGAVLFLEDVGEPLYRLDRMLTHLRSSGRLRDVKALICGSLRGCGPVAERARAWRRMVLESVPSEAVVVVDQPFGHGARNLAFPIGAVVEVDTAAGLIRWSD
jgi:muramoyltetrapeptide carboxypeptidase